MPEQDTVATARGRTTTGTASVLVPSCPSLSTTVNVTEYVPAAGKVWSMVPPVPDAPSPKAHVKLEIVPSSSQEFSPEKEQVKSVHEEVNQAWGRPNVAADAAHAGANP